MILLPGDHMCWIGVSGGAPVGVSPAEIANALSNGLPAYSGRIETATKTEFITVDGARGDIRNIVAKLNSLFDAQRLADHFNEIAAGFERSRRKWREDAAATIERALTPLGRR